MTLHASYRALGIPPTLLPTEYFRMIRMVATRFNVTGNLVQAAFTGSVRLPLAASVPSAMQRPLLAYKHSPTVAATGVKRVLPLPEPNPVRKVVAAHRAKRVLSPMDPAGLKTISAFKRAGSIGLFYSIAPAWIQQICYVLYSSRMLRALPPSDGFRWIALQWFDTSTIPFGLCSSGVHAKQLCLRLSSTAIEDADTRSALVAHKHASAASQALLTFLRLVLGFGVKADGDMPVVRKSFVMYGPARPPVATPKVPIVAERVGSQSAYWVSPMLVERLLAVFGAPQIPLTLPTSHGFYWIALRYFGTSGTRIDSATFSTGTSATEELRRRLRSDASAPADASPMTVESDSALVVDRPTSAASLQLVVFFRLVLLSRLSDNAAHNATPASESPSVPEPMDNINTDFKSADAVLMPVVTPDSVIESTQELELEASGQPVYSISPTILEPLLAAFGTPQVPTTLPMPELDDELCNRVVFDNCGTSGTRVEFTLPYGISPAPPSTGVSAKQLHLRLRSEAIARAASVVHAEPGVSSASVIAMPTSFAALQLWMFLRLTFECRIEDQELKPDAAVQPVYSISPGMVERILAIFAPPQLVSTVVLTFDEYHRIALYHCGTTGTHVEFTLPYGINSTSPATGVPAKQLRSRLRSKATATPISASNADSDRRSALATLRPTSAAGVHLLVFFRIAVYSTVQKTDDTTQVSAPPLASTTTNTDQLLTCPPPVPPAQATPVESPLLSAPTDKGKAPAFGIDDVPSSPIPANEAAEVEEDTTIEGEPGSERRRKRHPRARGGKKIQAAKARKMAREAEEAGRLAEEGTEVNDASVLDADENPAASTSTEAHRDAPQENTSTDTNAIASGSNTNNASSSRRRQPTRGRRRTRTADAEAVQNGSDSQPQGRRRKRRRTGGAEAGAMRIANCHLREAVGSDFVDIPPLRLGAPRTGLADEFSPAS
ncbi:uncharacterized protein C8Q71DRAFT_736595 [Rhodofomes roseus]|uniref:Uncharacterized protein n=1 Tax=Rhodofomes roseus TaxID=34475 RepID=A0ABQ8KRZ2_9APHY|nr:uncharacterized protein C8Q71DRAFT_736595 [Rhodofomes roseus]KAH9841365.1 hypothetical protein C8Q71DRAFT_736595 [Rhodofomes roseus]